MELLPVPERQTAQGYLPVFIAVVFLGILVGIVHIHMLYMRCSYIYKNFVKILKKM